MRSRASLRRVFLGVAVGTLLAIHARLKAAKQDFEAWLARQAAR